MQDTESPALSSESLSHGMDIQDDPALDDTAANTLGPMDTDPADTTPPFTHEPPAPSPTAVPQLDITPPPGFPDPALYTPDPATTHAVQQIRTSLSQPMDTLSLGLIPRSTRRLQAVTDTPTPSTAPHTSQPFSRPHSLAS